MLEADRLHKRFGGTRALDGVSFRVEPGQVVALLGENGAGKSTVGRVLSGVIRPDEGAVVVDGQPIALGRLRASRRGGISTAFQELSVVPDLTVAENLLGDRQPRTPLGHIRRRAAQDRARQILDDLGVAEIHAIDPGARLADLALAERQIVEVAKALAVAPKVLVLDEATSALPARESAWVLRKAREAAAAGAAVLFISHRMEEVRELADAFVIMRAGTVVQTGSPSELTDDDVIAAMLGRRVERLFPARSPARGEVVLSARDLRVGDSVGPVSFDVRAGEVFGVGGLEGQGQAELLLGIAGARRTRGEMQLLGEPFRPRDPHAALARGVGYVPNDRQVDGLFPFATIRGNVSIASLDRLRRGLSLDVRKERRMVEEQAGQLQLPVHRLDELVSVLSGGNQQKVVLSRILLTEPKVLLLHDCTRGVDVGTKAEIFELVAALAARGVAIILYSTDLTEVVHLCDRVAVMREGAVAAVLEETRLSEDEILRVAVSASQDPPAPAKKEPVRNGR